MSERIAIVGAGASGIATAIKLKEAGIEDFVILERTDAVGGTWHTNRYPGLANDLPSHLYCFSFAQKSDWTKPFAAQPEIELYMREVAEKFEVLPYVRFGTEVISASWDEERMRWRIGLADGCELEAEIFISALGMFNEIRWPEIAGLREFTGTLVHTARWPDDIDLERKDVAVIGSAASAVQLIPEIAPLASRLTVYQRTASWVLTKDDDPYPDAEVAARRRDPALGLALRNEAFEFLERWVRYDDEDMLQDFDRRCRENLALVKDPVLREALTPQVPFGAQRPLQSSDYYQVFNQEHVELVTVPVARMTPDAVITSDGWERRADAIILATGYNANKFLSVIDVTGRNGRQLRADWSEGPQAFKGMAVSGYPNLFMLYGPNTNNGSIIEMIELQADYLVNKIVRMHREHVAWLEVRQDVQDIYNQELQRNIDALGVWNTPGSKYYRWESSGRLVTNWPGTMTAFAEITKTDDWDAFERGSTLVPSISAHARGENSRDGWFHDLGRSSS